MSILENLSRWLTGTENASVTVLTRSSMRYVIVGGIPFRYSNGSQTFLGLKVVARTNSKVELEELHRSFYDQCGGLLIIVDTKTGQEITPDQCARFSTNTLANHRYIDPSDAMIHRYLDPGDTHAASGDTCYTGCFHCGRPRRDHTE